MRIERFISVQWLYRFYFLTWLPTTSALISNFITIKDIARELNISVATVSRALRDTYDVNKETRYRVLEMAQKLHYKPNINATGLAKGKTFNIGVILPFITNYYFSTVITGVQEIAYSKGYSCIVKNNRRTFLKLTSIRGFTRGSWKTNHPVDMSIAHGNLTTVK